jgi:hypothetical protein
MSRSRTLAVAALFAAGLLAACSDASTGPRPDLSCSEGQGSNTVVSCPK